MPDEDSGGGFVGSFDYDLSADELITMAETITKDVNRTLTDNPTISDTVQKALTRILDDIATITETLSKSVGRTFDDSATITEQLSIVYGRYRTLDDSVVITDTLARSIGKNITDTITMVEFLSIGRGKNLDDSVSISESFNVGKPQKPIINRIEASASVMIAQVARTSLTGQTYKSLRIGEKHYGKPHIMASTKHRGDVDSC